VAAHAHGKLDFDGAAQSVGSQLLEVVQQLRQGEDIVLEDGREGDDARAGTTETIADGVIVSRVGGGDVVQRAICLGIAQGKRCSRRRSTPAGSASEGD